MNEKVSRLLVARGFGNITADPPIILAGEHLMDAGAERARLCIQGMHGHDRYRLVEERQYACFKAFTRRGTFRCRRVVK